MSPEPDLEEDADRRQKNSEDDADQVQGDALPWW